MPSFLGHRFPALRRALGRRALRRRLALVDGRLALAPFNVELLEERAEVVERLGDRAETVSAFRELGAAYVRAGYYPHAIAIYARILDVDPSQTRVHGELADLIDRQREESDRRAASPPSAPPPASPPSVAAAPVAPPPAGPRPAADAGRTRERSTTALFDVLDRDALEELLASTLLRTYLPRQVVFQEGDPAQSLFVLVEGEVEAVGRGRDGVERRIERLGRGHVFGGVSAIAGLPRAATIRALAPTAVIEVSRQRIRHLGERHPQLLDVLRTFAEERAQRTIDVLVHGRD